MQKGKSRHLRPLFAKLRSARDRDESQLQRLARGDVFTSEIKWTAAQFSLVLISMKYRECMLFSRESYARVCIKTTRQTKTISNSHTTVMSDAKLQPPRTYGNFVWLLLHNSQQVYRICYTRVCLRDNWDLHEDCRRVADFESHPLKSRDIMIWLPPPPPPCVKWQTAFHVYEGIGGECRGVSQT